MRHVWIGETENLTGLERFSSLASDAINKLILAYEQRRAEPVRPEQLDYFMQLLATSGASDPRVLLQAIGTLRLNPARIACEYAVEAARRLGVGWLEDETSFVEVTVQTDRLQGLVRHVDAMVTSGDTPLGPSALILIAEAEQHTLGAHILGLQLRLAGINAMVRIAPDVAELTMILDANRIGLALISVGSLAGLEAGAALVQTLRALSPVKLPVYVGGAVMVDDETLMQKTGADRVVRDVSVLLAEYKDGKILQMLDQDSKRSHRSTANSSVEGDGRDQ